MIETVPIDFPSVFPIGVLVTVVSHRQIRSEKVCGWSRYVTVGFLLGIGYGLMTAFWAWEYPDWMWVYAFDAASWNFWLWYPLFVLGLGLTAAVGTWLSQGLMARGSWLGVLMLAALGLLALAILWAKTWEQYNHLSTYADWIATPRVATPLQEDSRWVTATNILGPAYGIPALLVALKLYLEGRRTPAL